MLRIGDLFEKPYCGSPVCKTVFLLLFSPKAPRVGPLKRIIALTLISLWTVLGSGCSTATRPIGSTTRTLPLTVAESWTLTPPTARFDASALVRLPDGRLLTVNDKETGLFEIRFPSSGTEAVLTP